MSGRESVVPLREESTPIKLLYKVRDLTAYSEMLFKIGESCSEWFEGWHRI